jgi:hypothetical protein
MHGDTVCPEKPKAKPVVKMEEADRSVRWANHLNKCFGLEVLYADNQDDKTFATQAILDVMEREGLC